MVNNSETSFGHGSSVYGVYHEGYGSGGERASYPATEELTIDPNSPNVEENTIAKTRNQAAKAEIVAKVDRIQKRKEIRKGTMPDGDTEVLLALSEILKALDPKDSELIKRVVALLQSKTS